MPSDTQIFLRFQDPCVFAGEELRCIITFKNVATVSEPQTPTATRRRSSRNASLAYFTAADLDKRAAEAHHAQRQRTQKEAIVDTAPDSNARRKLNQDEPDSPSTRPGQRHQRSVSIISIAPPTLHGPSGPPSRPSVGHKRSSTVQIIDSQRRSSQQSLAVNRAQQNGRRSPLSSTTPSTPALESRQSTPDFQLPPGPQRLSNQQLQGDPNNSLDLAPGKPFSANSKDASPLGRSSERSSGDFYSLSNHSQQTLMSEQPSVLSDKPQILNTMPRPQYQVEPATKRKSRAVNLLMGYAHLNATFTVDGSLVDQSQFEEIKQKGFLGGQAGGGVVGVNNPRPSSGFFGGFNFNSIGESLNSLVGGESMSSVKEMNQVTKSRAIPLLSTPQSLLFVDLYLEPGEEKSYSFSTTIPRGLPSSYRGKAIRITYNIQIGVQGLPGDKDVHKVRHISVPVRVFSGVDSDGEILGHDLFQPHVILKNTARTRSIDNSLPRQELERVSSKPTGAEIDFLRYVDTLLDRSRRRQSSAGMDTMLSANEDSSSPSVQAINKAILMSTQPTTVGDSSSNRFEITRNGMHVAVIMIDRHLHRLGEPVTAVVDFRNAEVLGASLHATLETTEKVSQSLALRSAASIARVTRRVYVSHSENILFRKRAVFAPTIPVSAPPTFITSGINLDWALRFDFSIVKATEQEDGALEVKPSLFEDVVNDERGIVSIAVERLECEVFEVRIPITVFGDILPSDRQSEDLAGMSI